MTLFQKICLLAVCLVLSACQTPIESDLGVTDNREVPYWTLDGDLIVITPKDRLRASLHWQQAPDQQRLQLLSQFGQTLMQVSRQLRKTELWYDNKLYTGPEAEALIYQITHWHLPIDPMRSWILGHPSPGSSQITYNDSGQIKSFRTGHKGELWRITYSGWNERYKLPFPQKIELQNLTQKTKFKIKIKAWEPQW